MPTSIAPSSSIAWPDDGRRVLFMHWLADAAPRHAFDPASLRAASADASFRRYFRVDGAAGQSFIVMDAPPPQEDVRAFVHVAALFQAAGLNAPHVLEQDVQNGFLLLTDLGSQLYLTDLQQAKAQGDERRIAVLMNDAIAALVQWQSRADASSLPSYDDALLRRELALFPDWCVAREYAVTWTTDQYTKWQQVCDLLIRSALAQPTVAVHRDYMPRNLMVCPAEQGNPGILDFQDAVRGPVSYDMASMLRDAFISWEEEQEIDCAVRYWAQARKAGLPVTDDFGDFWKQLEWMGLQRHLKVLGIFCRLKHRDGKPKYSEDLPRFFAYAHKVATRYNGLGPLAHLLEPLMGATRREAFY
jgi:aminoglycoside/choline kinase family phosphotransferase